MKWFFIALWLVLAASLPASAQLGMTGVGPGGFGEASAAPTVTYVNSYTATSGIGTTTIGITGVDIGNPAYIANRRVIIAMSGLGNCVSPVSGTINGASIDVVTSLSCGAAGSEGIDFASAPVSSGTTGVTVSITFAFATGGAPRFLIYIVDGSLLSSTTPATGYNSNTSGTGTNTATVNTTTKAGGFIIATAWVGGGAGPSITASTETYTTDYSSSANFSAHANSITSNASNSVSTQGPPAGGNSGLGLAAWR